MLLYCFFVFTDWHTPHNTAVLTAQRSTDKHAYYKHMRITYMY